MRSYSSRKINSFIKLCLPICLMLLLAEAMSAFASQASTIVSQFNLLLGIKEILLGITSFTLLSIPLLLMESFFPGTAHQRNYLKGFKFWCLYIVISVFWSKLFILLTDFLHLKPLLSWKIEGNGGGIYEVFITIFGILLSIFMFDFFYYWFHRAQHRFSFLWNFHKVHHSIDDMNCLNSYHHISEELFRIPFVMMPVTLLLSITTPKIIFLSAFINIYGQYIHSDTSINFGCFRIIFADNTIHRVHHSLAEEHYDKNFAAFFSILDRLFGTYAKPDDTKVPSVGLSTLKPPMSMYDYLRLPFQ